jgi:hypothetical protein
MAKTYPAKRWENAAKELAINADELRDVAAALGDVTPRTAAIFATTAEDAGIDPLLLAKLCRNMHFDASDGVSYHEEWYVGEYESGAELAKSEADHTFGEVPEHLRQWIDWQAYYDCDLRHDYFDIDGHYWRSV